MHKADSHRVEEWANHAVDLLDSHNLLHAFRLHEQLRLPSRKLSQQKFPHWLDSYPCQSVVVADMGLIDSSDTKDQRDSHSRSVFPT